MIEWNKNIKSADDYAVSPGGMQLLAANCTLITAIGEGINRINRLMPDFLNSNFPNIPWKSIIGMRNRIAHGYFELDADLVLEAIQIGIPPLKEAIAEAIRLIKSENCSNQTIIGLYKFLKNEPSLSGNPRARREGGVR